MQASVDGVQKGCFERPVFWGDRSKVMMDVPWRRWMRGLIGCCKKMALLVSCVSAACQHDGMSATRRVDEATQ